MATSRRGKRNCRSMISFATESIREPFSYSFEIIVTYQKPDFGNFVIVIVLSKLKVRIWGNKIVT